MAKTMLVGDMIRLHASNLPNETALVVGEQRFTYAEINRRINRTAHALAGLGVCHGDRVAVLGRNSVDYFCIYFALAKLGALLVPMNFWYRSEEHRYVLENSEPILLLHEPEFEAVLDDAVAGLSLRRLRIPASGTAPEAEWSALLDTAGEAEPEANVTRDDPHMILYTSGTTGRPKGALLSHGRTIDDAFGMAAALRVRQTDTFVNYFPPFHVGNWDHQKIFLLVGAKLVLMPQFEPRAVLRAAEVERATVILGVPTMLHALLNHEDFPRTDLSAVRLVYYGAYDPSGIMDRTADAFGAREGRIEMAHTYGLTEAGPFVTLCASDELFGHWGSIGRAVPGVEVALLDDDCNPVPQGEKGEICMRGPCMSGYWRNPEATEAAFAGGWMHTGDIGVADERGFMWIVDRKKDMIRSGGQNIYSKEVEDRISSHPDVADCAVVGLDDPVYEELVCAVIVPRAGVESSHALAADITSFVRNRMAGYNAPRRVIFLTELPKNAVGKVQKHILRHQLKS